MKDWGINQLYRNRETHQIREKSIIKTMENKNWFDNHIEPLPFKIILINLIPTTKQYKIIPL